MMSQNRRSWAALILFLLLAGIRAQQHCDALETTGKHVNSVEDRQLEHADDLGNVSDDDEDYAEDDEDVNDEGWFEGFDGLDFDDSFDDEEEALGVGEGEDDEENNVFDEKDVVVLGSGNFSEFVRSNHYVLVEFYAPWCGHCQALAPEFADAATILKEEAALVKVDATINDELAQEYGVDGYPSLFFFIDGVHKPYSGQRRRDEIVAWVKKKTGPPVFTLNGKKDAEAIMDSLATMVIALLNSLEGSEVEEYTSAARQEDGVLFFQTDSAEVAQLFDFPGDVKRPAIVMLKQQPEKISWFDGPFRRDSIEAFVTKNKLPLVITFNKETAELIFESPIKKQIILFTHADDYEKLIDDFKEASKALMGMLVFVHVDLDDAEQAKGIIEFFGISTEKPTVMGYEAEENGRKFLLEGTITAETVKAFGEDFVSNNLKPHLKSDPVPEKNDDDVKIVVGLNLDDIVLDETKDVFLEIYAPWCGHCQALAPTWDKLAKRLRGVESIVIAKMDGTRNEHSRAQSDGYPTLLFFPAGKKSFDPITFDGDRTTKEFVKFLKKEAGIPFTVPKKPDSPQNISKAGGKTEPSTESISTTMSGEHTSESDRTTKPVEPLLTSVVEDQFNSPKDEL